MPEAPNPKLREIPAPSGPAAVAARPYAELDIKTNFSFLAGASHPDELVYRAAELGYRAVAITDFNSLAGVVRAHEAAKESGLHLLIGARLRFADAPDLLAWTPDRKAYARLCRLLTLGKRRAEKGDCSLSLQDFLNESQGLHAAMVWNAREEPARSDHALSQLKDAMQDRVSLAVSCGYGPDDATCLQRAAEVSHHFGIPLLATNDVYYHDPARRVLQDVLTCIRHGCTIREAGFKLFPNGERYLKSPEQMHRLFADYPSAIRRALDIAEQCTFRLDELRYEYPDELTTPGMTAIEYLSELAWKGAATRYPAGVPEKVARLVKHELALIEQLRFEHYFLTVYDLVTFARSRKILCQGRGSAANSAVCYCLGVTSVDPDRIDLLFERFISAARGEPPDIDVDFEHERREEVLQYLYDKYGRDRAAMTAEVITYRGRSAVRDVGKAMGLSLDMVDSLAGKIDWWHKGVVSDAQIRETGLDPADRTLGQVMALATELLGFPRHLSQHVGGMVMTQGPLCEMVPIENATMADRTMIEWDKDDIDAIGILKVDVLALGMLTCISKAFVMIERMGKGLRDEGTKGQREEGLTYQGVMKKKKERTNDEQQQSDSSDISGFDCVAKGDGAGQNAVSNSPANAGIGEISIGESDVAGIILRPVEYSGGIWASITSGLHEISTDRSRLPLRTLDTIRVGDQPAVDPVSPGIEPFDRGRRQDPSSTHHEFGTQESGGDGSEEERKKGQWDEGTKGLREGNRKGQRDKGTKGLRDRAASSPKPFVPSSLCPSVPSSPKPFVPSSLCPSVPSSPKPFVPSSLCPSVPSSPKPFVPSPNKLELHTVPPEDPLVYEMLSNADSVGVFQVESRAQMSMLPRLQPRCFYDLVIEVAIVRPGPIQGDMVHPYLRRRSGLEPVSFPSEALRQVLGKTLGVPLFQEQAMRVAMVGAGFSAEEADKLRRAMAAWRRTNAIEMFHRKIVDGMLKNGYTREFAEQCFNQIRGFGEYGFPESHAASFALLVYVSAWLKRHHPAAFAAALINSQPMGFYMPAQIVRDAKEHGVGVREVDVNASEWDCILEEGQRESEARNLAEILEEGQRDEGKKGQRGRQIMEPAGSVRNADSTQIGHSHLAERNSSDSLSPVPRGEGWGEGPAGKLRPSRQDPSPQPSPLSTGEREQEIDICPPSEWGKHGPIVRLGFRQLKGFRQQHADLIVSARKRGGRFTSIAQFHRLTGLPVSAMRLLAEADAFGSLGFGRREALWQVMKLKDEYYPLFDGLEPAESAVQLPKMPAGQEVMIDYATAGLSLKQHPVSLMRDELRKRKIITAAELANVEHNRWVKVAGLVLIRQRPGTASGVVFETLEDETGVINLIVHPKIYDQYRPAARHARVLQADGYVQRQGKIIHVLPKRLFDLSDLLDGYQMRSRDFH